MTGRLYVGTSGFGYPGLGTALLPGRHPIGRPAARLRHAAPGGRAERDVLPLPSAGHHRRLAGSDPARLPLRGQGAAERLDARLGDGPGEYPALAAGAGPSVRGSPWRRALPGRRRAAPQRRTPRTTAGRRGPARCRSCSSSRIPSWDDDEVHARLRAAGAILCATDLPEAPDPPTLRLTGPALYARLRRDDYSPAELDAWAARFEPFLSSGIDAFVFFKHDPVGRGGELALELQARSRPRRRAGVAPG